MGEGNVLTCVCPSIHDSVCPHGGGGGQSSVQPVGGSGPAGRGGSGPAGGGGQVQLTERSGPAGWGSGPARGGQVQLAGGVRSS